MDSILTSIKKLLGITEEYEHSDQDIIIHIKTALMILTQLGVGPSEGFFIKDKYALWSDFIPDVKTLEAVKSYIYLKVRMLFDPPTSSSLMNAMEQNMKELEWRLNVASES